MPSNVIAIDVGRSAVKIAAGPTPFLIPTAVYPAQDISVDEAAAQAKAETVAVGGREFFFGETAALHSAGRMAEGLRDDWIETPDHIALLKGAFETATRKTGQAGDFLVLGLPSKLHGQQKGRLRELASMHLGLSPERVLVLPQPMGAYMAMMLDASGNPMPGRDPTIENWGVVDVGYYTTDFGTLLGGRWSVSGQHSSQGTFTAAEIVRDRLQKYGIELRQAEEILRTKSFRHQGEVRDAAQDVEIAAAQVADKIISTAIQVFGMNLNTFNGILLVGGGAELVFKSIKAKWPHTHTPEAPRFAVAEGMRRYGLMAFESARGA